MEKNTENKKIFLDIDGIGLSQECVEFLHERLKPREESESKYYDDYRGWHYSQHNRYTFDHVVLIFTTLREFVKENEYLLIRTSDLSKKTQNHRWKIYSEFCKKVKQGLERKKNIEDVMRKNFFVDFHRMNLLERYDKKGNLIEIGAKRPVSKVKISLWGNELVDSSSIGSKYLVYSKAVDFFLKERVMEPIIEIMREHDNYLELEEFQFFVSFLGRRIDNKVIDKQKIRIFLEDYRNLSFEQKDYLTKKIKDYCDPKKFSGSKKDKRDFGNWKNGTQQFFTLLDTTAYFELTKRKNKLILGKIQSFDKELQQITKIVRSNVEKQKYFIEHRVSKELGFELHHIRPLFRVRNLAELKLTDSWKNMLYIRAYEHRIVTQSWHKVSRTKLSFLQKDDDVLFLSDINNDSIIEFRNKENIHYDPSKKKLLLDYNKEMLGIQ